MSEQNTGIAPAQSRSEHAVRIIVQEHQALWRVLDLLDQLLSDMNLNDQRPDERLIRTIFDYIQHFSRRVHSTPTDIALYSQV
jgi:branched-chain amino acid transport system ATP-binding protein